MDMVPVGDFAWYDRMLNMCALLGCAPRRFGFGGNITTDQYFQLARGNEAQGAMEMTKWFDTNYHYLVPEFDAATSFSIGAEGLFDELDEAKAGGRRSEARPDRSVDLSVAGQGETGRLHPPRSAPRPAPRLRGGAEAPGSARRRMGPDGRACPCAGSARGMDEPSAHGVFGTRGGRTKAPPRHVFRFRRSGGLGIESLARRGPAPGPPAGAGTVPSFLADFPEDKVLSAGIVDGRNIWRNDLDASLEAPWRPRTFRSATACGLPRSAARCCTFPWTLTGKRTWIPSLRDGSPSRRRSSRSPPSSEKRSNRVGKAR